MAASEGEPPRAATVGIEAEGTVYATVSACPLPVTITARRDALRLLGSCCRNGAAPAG
jgi:hypothetical protein